MNDITKTLLEALIAEVVIAPLSIFTDYLGTTIEMKILWSILPYIAIVAVILLIKYIHNGSLKAYFDICRLGKFRGLWSKEKLVAQIEDAFLSANTIKIKVTRGESLLHVENDFGLTKILSKLRDGKGKDKVVVKILLIVPCYQLEHVRHRHSSHNNLTEVQFLETWYQFIRQIQQYRSQHLSINVKFFNENHTHWRFYVSEGEKPTILLSDYEDGQSGSSTPMYKILKGNNNIAASYDDYFNELWQKSLTTRDLYEQIEQQTINNCRNCRLNHSCKENIKHYQNDLLQDVIT